MKPYGICLSLAFLPSIISTLLQKVRFPSFLWPSGIPLCTGTAVFTRLSVDGHWGRFRGLAVVSSAAVSIGCMYSFKSVFWVSLDIYSKVESLLGHKADPFLHFWGNSTLSSTAAQPVCILTKSAQGFPFLTWSPLLVVCWFIEDDHSDRCEVICHHGFNLHFSDN